MKQLISLWVIISVLACSGSTKQDTVDKHEAPRKVKKLKSVTSVSFITDSFAAYGKDSLVFEEKIIQFFDTSGKMIERKQFIIDSTILHRHHYQTYQGDTILKIDKKRGNFYRPNPTADTTFIFNDLVVEERMTMVNRHFTDSNGNEVVLPPSSKINYSYDEKGRLTSSTSQQGSYVWGCNLTYEENKECHLKRKICHGLTRSAYIQKSYYNEKQLKTKEIQTSFLNDTIFQEHVTFYQYNAKDSLIYKSLYRNGENSSIYRYEFNDLGQKVADYLFNDNKGDSTLLSMQYLYGYDEYGRLKTMSIVGINGDPLQSNLYTYDENGNKIEERRYNHSIYPDGKSALRRLLTRYYYEYY